MTTLPQVLDHYDDGGLLLRRKFAGQDVPAVIRSAADMSNVHQKLAGDYAVTTKTEYGNEFRLPVVDAGNTVASALYFAEYGDQLSPEMQKTAAARLRSALESFGFDVPEELTKTATIDLVHDTAADDRALEALFGVGPEDQMEIVRNAFDDFSPRGKRRMVMKMKEAGALVPDDIADYGGSEIGTDIYMALELRGFLLADSEANTKLAHIRQQANDDVDPSQLVESLEQFDNDYVISHLYGRHIPDPYASVYGTTLQTKEASLAHVEVDGRTFSAEDIRGFASAQEGALRDQFGDDFADQFAQDPVAVLHSLPVTHQRALARMI